MKKLKNLLVMAGLTTAMAIMVSGCGLKQMNASERAERVITAYQTDVETFKSCIEDDCKMKYMLEALDDENAKGMIAVYQKLYELTQNAEFTVTENTELGGNKGEYATVTIKTVDFTSALEDAMVAAITESGDAFADMPTWMLEALNTGGEAVEVSVDVRTHSNGDLYDGFNDEFYEALTGGFYDFLVSTMTTCVVGDGTEGTSYMLSVYDSVYISVDEYIMPFDGMEYSDEEVNAFIDEYSSQYEEYDGMFAYGNRIDDGMRLYLCVNYDVASTNALQRLGLISSGSGDRISLKSSIKGLEAEGCTCETTDFGSGVLAAEEESTEEE